MVHLYIGNGKGKTSAALGLCLRAAGFGKRAYIAQFLKSDRIPCGEQTAAKRRLKGHVTIRRFKHQEHPFFAGKKRFYKQRFQRSLERAVMFMRRIVGSGKYDVVVLDEILDAAHQKFIDEISLVRLIRSAKGTELILTGRTASARIRKYADYISLITQIKHPFQRGIPARRGIEY